MENGTRKDGTLQLKQDVHSSRDALNTHLSCTPGQWDMQPFQADSLLPLVLFQPSSACLTSVWRSQASPRPEHRGKLLPVLVLERHWHPGLF